MTRITPDDSLFAADDAAVETDAATGAGAMARADATALLDQEKCTGCGRDCRLAAPLCELGRDLAQEPLEELAGMLRPGTPEANELIREAGWQDRFAADAAHRKQCSFCG